jgi:nicotinamide-nucleotide amidase
LDVGTIDWIDSTDRLSRRSGEVRRKPILPRSLAGLCGEQEKSGTTVHHQTLVSSPVHRCLMGSSMQSEAAELVRALASERLRVVFAESCTGGLVAAELAKIPGVSEWLCGSAVTYRCDTKTKWLGVRADDIQRYTAVSSQVAEQMASGVLTRTPEASVSASVTGHLGPDAPQEQDGVIFIAVAIRVGLESKVVETKRHLLKSTDRESRQQEAATTVIKDLLDVVTNR